MVDTADVHPSEATLRAWRMPCELPRQSRHSAVARQSDLRVRRMEACTRLRAMLDDLVDAGDLSHSAASQLLAALEAAMIRSASTSAS